MYLVSKSDVLVKVEDSISSEWKSWNKQQIVCKTKWLATIGLQVASPVWHHNYCHKAFRVGMGKGRDLLQQEV